MKKFAAVFVFIFAWFISYEMEAPLGYKAKTVIGAFSSEDECKAYAEEMKEMFEAFDIPAKWGKCYEEREA